MLEENNRKVYLYSGWTDMRLGIFGLIKLIDKPEIGGVYAFCGKNRRTVKILEYHGTYAWLHTKKIFKGKLNWPDGENVASLDLRSLKLLIDSIDIINKVELKGDKILHTY